MPRLPRRRKSQAPSDSPPLLTGFSQADTGEESEGDRNKRLLIELGLKVTGAFMLTVAVLYWAVATVLGSGIIVPKDAEDILRSAKVADHYSWSSESVRQVNLGGNDLRQDTFRSTVVDLHLNRVQALTVGALPGKTLYVSDGNLTARLTDADQKAGRSWRLITDACQNKPAVPAKLLTMPTPDQLADLHPEVISDNGTVFGERAWVMSFKPDAALLKRVFWLEFLDAATEPSPDDRRWLLSEKEREAITSGKVTLDYAYAWVTRDKPRELRQLELRFYTDKTKTSGYRFLVKYFPPPEGERELQQTSFGEPDCNASRVQPNGSPTAPNTP